MIEVNVLLALSAGAAAFLSPCCLPLYPTYLSYLTGISMRELQGEGRTVKTVFHTMSHTIVFMAGFSLSFTIRSVMGSTALRIFLAITSGSSVSCLRYLFS